MRIVLEKFAPDDFRPSPGSRPARPRRRAGVMTHGSRISYCVQPFPRRVRTYLMFYVSAASATIGRFRFVFPSARPRYSGRVGDTYRTWMIWKIGNKN
ncbi:hypothetical protein EVAR_84528_1 [Eumeta japonica]|uniref:Uncharacterized protein n=1 Tax=Eumeta variegata TaxID=151549 RepID=A0A4C1UI25_EUMVA|nr:hypothetical protein EVAR_84528_1 [Eumeta japonica]